MFVVVLYFVQLSVQQLHCTFCEIVRPDDIDLWAFTHQLWRFLARDAMHKRGICRHAVLSVCHVRELRQKNKDIFEIFLPSVATPF